MDGQQHESYVETERYPRENGLQRRPDEQGREYSYHEGFPIRVAATEPEQVQQQQQACGKQGQPPEIFV